MSSLFLREGSKLISFEESGDSTGIGETPWPERHNAVAARMRWALELQYPEQTQTAPQAFLKKSGTERVQSSC